jgi:stage V sporulation protein B
VAHADATPGRIEGPDDLGATAATAGDDTARAAGRGGLAIAGAKLAFILFGFAQQLILPRLVGVDGYGQLRTVLSIVSIVNNSVVAMSIQGVSRAVARAPGREPEAFRATMRVHVVVAMIVSLGFAALAAQVARFEGAPHFTAPLRLVALVVLLYGLYAPVVGSLNGRRRFLDQAGLDTAYSVLRTVGLTGGAVLFARAGMSGVMGALAGFVAAASVILPIALARAGLGKIRRGPLEPGGGPRVVEYLLFLLPVAGGQILLNLLMFTDLLLLRSYLAQAAEADTLAGIYAGAQTFAFLPYQFLMSVTFILFPMLARAQATGDRAEVRSFAMGGVRLAMLLTALITGTVAGLAPHVLRVAYPAGMWSGGEALRVLCLGMGSFSILGVTCAALTSLGRALESALLTAMGVALIAAGCVIFVPRASYGLPMLTTTAAVTASALTLTVIAGGARLHAVAGGFVAPLTLLRVLAALAACVVAGSRMPWIGKAGTVLEAALVVGVGLAVLVAFGEVGRADLARIAAVAGRRTPAR